ncbi:hypothetical protein LSAT2_025008 [Lamellibrachia satsuma]|nr:hypothetical protein LSAT2_025008 [Lamellibrachia satsuma]
MSKGVRRLPPMVKHPRKAKAAAAGGASSAAADEDEAGSMDADEKKVLRRKKNVLANHIQLDDEWIQGLTVNGLVSDFMLTQIKDEGTNFNKVIRLLELMSTHCEGPGAFGRLCDVLETRHPWLSQELVAELKAERGELKIERYVEHEAGLLVRRAFGASKRLSQAEKNDIHRLVALRTQYAKESMLERTKNDLVQQRLVGAEQESYAGDLLRKVSDFVRVQQGRLRHNLHEAAEASTTQQLLNDSEDERSLLKRLEHQISLLEELTTQALLEKEALLEERKRALAVLGTKDATGRKLDIEIQAALDKATTELTSSHADLKRRDTKLQNLDNEIQSLRSVTEHEIDWRDKAIETLKEHLQQSHERVRQTHETAVDLERRLKVTKAEVSKYKAKAELLEKNRRLGYLHDRSEKGSEAGDVPVGVSAAAAASGKPRGSSVHRRSLTGKTARK